jgi:hypothetical protein
MNSKKWIEIIIKTTANSNSANIEQSIHDPKIDHLNPTTAGNGREE